MRSQQVETGSVLQQRINAFLSRYRSDRNSFVQQTEAAEAAKSMEVEEAGIEEYILKRAEEELRQAQLKVDQLKQQLEERQQPD